MVSPRWKKVLRDLWLQKMRTILVVLSITIGVFAFGSVAAARTNVLEKLRSSYLEINPMSAVISTEPFGEELADVVQRVPGVALAEGQRKVQARIKIGPNRWQDTELFVIPDDGDMEINIVRPVQGPWPPPDHAVMIERSSLGKINAEVGDQVVVEIANEQHVLPLVGLTHDLSLPPAPIAGKAYGHMSFDTLEWFGLERDYTDMKIVVSHQREDEAHIWSVVERVEKQIEDSGREVDVSDVPEPLQHPAEQVLPTLLLILGGLGTLTLLLGMFLIVNTVEAILTQQIRQIGMMKAIGARNGQIMRLYFGMVLAFGTLALALALPLGSLGARTFTQFMMGQLNVDLHHFEMPPPVLLLNVAAAMLLPILVAVPSVLSASRITVREAIDNNMAAMGQSEGGLIDRIMQRIKGMPRPLLLSLRNTFRRKGRLVRTLAVLTLAGTVFMSVLTVRSSLYATLDRSVASKLYDVEVRFSRPYRSAKVEQGVLALPGVTEVESWGFAKAYPVRPDDSEGEALSLYAPPAETDLLKLEIEQGRWLLPEDEHAIVVSSNYVSKKEPGTRLGDEIELRIGGEENTWRIVGISQEFMSPVQPAIGYVNYPTFVRVTGKTGYVDNLLVATEHHDAAFQEQVVRELEAHVERNNLQVRLIRSTSEDRAILSERFNILTAVLSIMATLVATVGAIGLTGTMSINVIERRKEIGIMRAIGASDGAVRLIVMAEGVVIGLLSWGAGTLLSLPVSRLMSMRLGYSLLNEPLHYRYAFYAVGLWLALALILSALASLLPAQNALRITIREVLAFE